MRSFVRDALITLAVLAVVVAAAGFASLNRVFFGAAGPVEAAVADRARRLAIPSEARRASNPLAAQTDAWRGALAHYAEHCESCHAYDGRGGGEIGRHLNPRVPDMTRPRTQTLSDGELFYIIQNGVRFTGMPAWKSEHTAAESWRLVSFVRHIPMLTAADMREIVAASGREHHHGHEDDAASGDADGDADGHASGDPHGHHHR
jgi:mono/diheme cytochrome c family protein